MENGMGVIWYLPRSTVLPGSDWRELQTWVRRSCARIRYYYYYYFIIMTSLTRVKPVSKAVINGCPGVLYGRKFQFFPASFCNKLSYLKLSYSSIGAIKNYETNVGFLSHFYFQTLRVFTMFLFCGQILFIRSQAAKPWVMFPTAKIDVLRSNCSKSPLLPPPPPPPPPQQEGWHADSFHKRETTVDSFISTQRLMVVKISQIWPPTIN